jgi:hypothetical protein
VTLAAAFEKGRFERADFSNGAGYRRELSGTNEGRTKKNELKTIEYGQINQHVILVT